ncbi:MAG TPA: hypothetical protein VGF58_11080 [Burkholderiales bacterium]|jgi:hypothetical protein
MHVRQSGKRLEMQSKSASVLLLGVLLGAAAACNAAQPGGDNAFTLYAGYRDGGRFTDVTSGSKLPIEASGVGAVSLDIGLNPQAGTQIQIYLSRQRSEVDARLAAQPVSSAAPVPAKFPLAVTYAHVGGTIFPGLKIGQGAYLAGGLGATLFEPDLQGLANELRPSISLGIGYQLPLGGRVALRFEARGYATLVNSSSALFCSGGCALSIKGDTVTQGDILLGLAFTY